MHSFLCTAKIISDIKRTPQAPPRFIQGFKFLFSPLEKTYTSKLNQSSALNFPPDVTLQKAGRGTNKRPIEVSHTLAFTFLDALN